MEGALSSQQTVFYTIKQALVNFKKIGRNNLTPAICRARISSLQGAWSECVRNHAVMLQLVPEKTQAELNYFKEDQFGTYFNTHQTALDHMHECLEHLEPVVSRNSSFTSTQAPTETSSFSLNHLPPIKLPPFSGKPDEWENFRDRFKSLITDNQELSNFSRMHFLVASLTGSARDSIANLKVTADNFKVAWKALTEQFENKRRLIEVHVSTLYNLPKLHRESASELHALRDKSDQAFEALRRLERSSDDIVSDMLVYFISQKLDPATRRAWKLKIGDNVTPPTYDELKRFLSSRASALEDLHSESDKTKVTSKVTSATAAAFAYTPCPLCQQQHFLSRCKQFVAKSPSQRRELIKQFKRCFNCLSDKHSVLDCTSKYTCHKCHQRHHTMIHVDSNSSPQTAVASVAVTENNSTVIAENVTALSSVTLTTAPTPVILSTATITVRSPPGRAVIVRALLDSGSELTFLTERTAQLLRLSRIRTHTTTSGLSCVNTGTCRSAAIIHIAPRDCPEPTFTTVAYIIKALTKYAPRGAPSTVEWKHLSNLRLADEDPTGSTPIDLIIGADLYNRVLIHARNGPIGQPGAIESNFGWVLSGASSDPLPVTRTSSNGNVASVMPRNDIQDSANNEHPNAHQHQVVANCCAIDQELRKFWEVEEIPRSQYLSSDEQKCEDHFISTHSRSSDGRYTVRLPFRTILPIDIGESRDIAKRRLMSLKRKLDRQPAVNNEYSEFLREYERLNHMTRVDFLDQPHSQIVYIPHHAVFRASSATTRLRVVFDASSKTTNNTSLNTHLLVGPKLQADLTAVLLRWRQHEYVYSADIAKMYRQILVHPEDRDYQRILWNDNSSTIHEYQLNTVTYGTASAPFLALRVLKQLTSDEGADFPLASAVLNENLYVDDVLFGAGNRSLLRQIRDQICKLLDRGGFKLRKWASNKAELLSDIPSDGHGLACPKVLENDDSLKVLGISWNPTEDVFLFNLSLPSETPSSKRAILSMISRLFDPLGWITPLVLSAKVLMQQLWKTKLDWDDLVPENLLSRWNLIYDSLPRLKEIKIKRWTFYESERATMEIHGFADASTVAYAAAVYLRVTTSSGNVVTTLIAGKSKVAPLKVMTIPRLELSAAALLSRLIEFVTQSLRLNHVKIYCWTDSTVTLAWVSKQPSNWRTFVAHRVADIQARVPTAFWQYVSTRDNPADCASRGLLGGDLLLHETWWQGPPWLALSQDKWPRQRAPPPIDDLLESKSTAINIATPINQWDLASRYWWWPKLVRVTAYIKRFTNSRRNKIQHGHDFGVPTRALTAIEFNQARTFWLRKAQAELFPHEIAALQQGRSVSSKSPILSLSPFLDADNLIRVGGRLKHSALAYKSKHPILLAGHPITSLIICYTHLMALHAGTHLTLATLRHDFWILRARNLVKSAIHRCVTCTREKAKAPVQLMGQLPASRVSVQDRAFLHCGVDYAGPIATRASPGRGITSRKSYITLFVCLAIRAIHLELVSDYSTSTFLNAFLRFCARRGLPKAMYSDNGTTFTGADNELAQAYQLAITNPDFLNRIATDNIEWQFIPPHAPHFGGLWEAGVKSVKHHLRRIVGSHTLTFEEFTTVLCRIEACLNSRPLGPLTAELDDYEALTPAHFLIGTPLTTHPEPSTLHLHENRLSRWQLLRQLTERFWKQWQSDYVNTLQQRSKWRVQTPSIKIGSMVLVKNPLIPPCK